MKNQSLRLFLYSSIAILALTLAWGIQQIPKQRDLAEKVLRSSLDQELLSGSSAVRGATQALRFQLLDVLKAEGNDRPTRAFQDSPFAAATLLQWDQSQWNPLWHTSKLKSDFLVEQVKAWSRDWGLAQLGAAETRFIRVAEVQGQVYFAVLTSVRKPNGIPMVGVGILPANQFGLILAADRTREVKVFNDKGYALALTRATYVGSMLKGQNLVELMLESDQVSMQESWTTENGQSLVGVATRIPDTNLMIAIEAPESFGTSWYWAAWFYLVLCALGAMVLNWFILNTMMKPLFAQLVSSDAMIEQLKRALTEATTRATLEKSKPPIPQPELDSYSFVEAPPLAPKSEAATPETAADERVPLAKIVHSALRSQESRLQSLDIQVRVDGLQNILVDKDSLQLQTAIEEILKNAIEAMEVSANKNLSLDAYAKDGRAILKIRDTGCGIDTENLNKIFDPFFSTKDAQGVSRGLGLNVARRVLEEMHGQVHVVSRVNEGSTITLEWPNAAMPAAQAVDSSSVANDERHEAVLLDEDDDFAHVIMNAPLVPTAKTKKPSREEWSQMPIRKPKVRTLD